MSGYRLIINGWKAPAKSSFAVVNPATGQELAQCARASPLE